MIATIPQKHLSKIIIIILFFLFPNSSQGLIFICLQRMTFKFQIKIIIFVICRDFQDDLRVLFKKCVLFPINFFFFFFFFFLKKKHDVMFKLHK